MTAGIGGDHDNDNCLPTRTGDIRISSISKTPTQTEAKGRHLAPTSKNCRTVGSGSVPYIEPRPVPSRQGTIGEKIRHFAETQPEHPAMVSSGFAPLSYGELQVQIEELQAALRGAELGPCARIAVAMPNGSQAALAIVAVSCSAVSVPLNPRQTLQELDRCLAAVRPDAVLLIKGDHSEARRAAEGRDLSILEVSPAKGGIIGFQVVEPRTRRTMPDGPNEPDLEAPAFIFQTSGTSAEPKLIPFSHRNMLAAAARHQAWYKLTPQDRCLSVTAPFYSHGLTVTIFTPLLTGGSIAFPTDATKFEYAEWFTVLKPTWYSAGPTLHHLILDRTALMSDASAKHSLRFITGGGAPLPLNVLRGLQNTLDVPMIEHYGTSEAALTASNQPPPAPCKAGTCGVPSPDTLIIVGDDGNRVPPGKQGEILVGGPTLFSGYLDAPELNRRCFLDGWFRTGDIGSLDADGFLTIHGRKTEFINRGGEKVSPIEVDQALMRHPAVAEAAAFSIPHPRLGEDVAAAVVLRPGMNASAFELRRHLQDQIALFKVPRRIVIRNRLPKGATGKVLRRQLTESWQDEPAPASQITAPESHDGRFVDLVVQITAIWERLLNIAPFNLEDDFFEMGGDSLLAVNMLAELDQLTGEVVPASILFDAPTIRQLAQKLFERSKLPPKYLVEINSSGRQLPLVLFHGDYIWGGGHLTVELSKLLGPDQPIYVVHPHGGKDFPRSVETMAAERLPVILQAQPEGPYRLCGYCLGGIVAFETARLLLAAGKKVDVVFLIDAPTVNARKSVQSLLSAMSRMRPQHGVVVDHMRAWTWYMIADLQRAWNVSSARRWAAIKTRVRNLASSIGRKVKDRAIPPKTDIAPFGNFADARSMKYAAAMSNYYPRPLAVRIVYIAVDYGIGRWRRISSDCEVVKSEGTHYKLHIPKVADVLRAHLHVNK